MGALGVGAAARSKGERARRRGVSCCVPRARAHPSVTAACSCASRGASSGCWCCWCRGPPGGAAPCASCIRSACAGRRADAASPRAHPSASGASCTRHERAEAATALALLAPGSTACCSAGPLLDVGCRWFGAAMTFKSFYRRVYNQRRTRGRSAPPDHLEVPRPSQTPTAAAPLEPGTASEPRRRQPWRPRWSPSTPSRWRPSSSGASARAPWIRAEAVLLSAGAAGRLSARRGEQQRARGGLGSRGAPDLASSAALFASDAVLGSQPSRRAGGIRLQSGGAPASAAPRCAHRARAARRRLSRPRRPPHGPRPPLCRDQPPGFPFEGYDLEELILPDGDDMGIRSDDDESEEEEVEAVSGFGSVIGGLGCGIGM